MLGDAAATATPEQFQPLWNEVRAALDGGGDAERALSLLFRMPGNACDPGAPKYVGYIGNAAAPLARAADAFVSIANPVAAGRIDGHSFVQAEFAVTDKFGELAGFPAKTRGGTFVQGGTLANFCALAVARAVAEKRWQRRQRQQPAKKGMPQFSVIGSRKAHSSIKLSTRLLGMEYIPVELTSEGAIDVDHLRQKLVTNRDKVAAVVGTAGTTTAGSLDPLAEIADLAAEFDCWFHVDGAYGGALLLSSRYRGLLAGIEKANSFVADPHKWMFCPYDASMLVYRDAKMVRKLKVFDQSHEEDSDYLNFGLRHTAQDATPRQLPLEHTDLALQLSRRPRGISLWALLAAYGVESLGSAVDHAIDTIRELAAYAIGEGVQVPVRPTLSVLLLGRQDYRTSKAWDAKWVLPAHELGYFVSTDKWQGKHVGRICLVNPSTTSQDLVPLIELLKK
jgi:glutamate/tyrosine decarboxylase-like PLP-dependent enzyme